MSVFQPGIAKHLIRNRIMKHNSRLTVCWANSIHIQAKALMLRPPDLNFGEIRLKGQFCNAFLANCLLLSRKRLQKYEEKLNWQNFISNVQKYSCLTSSKKALMSRN